MASPLLANAMSNRHVQLAATAIASGAVVASAIIGWQRFSAEGRMYRLKRSIPPPDEISHTSQTAS